MKILILLLFIAFTFNITFAQKASIKSFYALFEKKDLTVPHIYSFPKTSSAFTEMASYQYKGVKIDTAFYKLMKTVLKPINAEMKYTDFFATLNFYIGNNLEALLVREFHKGKKEHHIHCIIYDSRAEKMMGSEKLSYAYDEEGCAGVMDSWIIDLDKDGQKDILSYTWSQYFSPPDAHEEYKDSIVVSIWLNNELFQTGISDLFLKAYIKKDFLHLKKKELSYLTKVSLNNFLEEKTKRGTGEVTSTSWGIMAGSDKSLPAAVYELDRARKIIGMNNEYGLDYRLFAIYKKNNRYYTIIKTLGAKKNAEMMLFEVKKIFNPSAYIINLKNWCKELEYQKDGCYKCID